MMRELFEELTNTIQKYEVIYLMSHRYMDLDGLGAAVGIANVIKKYQKEPRIIINKKEQETAGLKAIEKLEKKKLYHFVESSSIDLTQMDQCLLLILDVHKKEMLEIPDLISYVKEFIIVDHHIKREAFLEGTLNYLAPHVSSTVEIIVNYLKQENLNIDSLTATIMLAGMYIDTNGFNVKTNEETYLAAAYLMENHADNVLKQELFQEDKKAIVRRQKLLKNSFKVGKNGMVCVLDKNIYKTSDLAKLAEELLQFETIEVSFVIGYIAEDTIGMSARSLGKVKVEKIMKQLGGGGHKTDAASKFQNTSLSRVKEELLNILR